MGRVLIKVSREKTNRRYGFGLGYSVIDHKTCLNSQVLSVITTLSITQSYSEDQLLHGSASRGRSINAPEVSLVFSYYSGLTLLTSSP